jgi:hypothetical protein
MFCGRQDGLETAARRLAKLHSGYPVER